MVDEHYLVKWEVDLDLIEKKYKVDVSNDRKLLAKKNFKRLRDDLYYQAGQAPATALGQRLQSMAEEIDRVLTEQDGEHGTV